MDQAFCHGGDFVPAVGWHLAAQITGGRTGETAASVERVAAELARQSAARRAEIDHLRARARAA